MGNFQIRPPVGGEYKGVCRCLAAVHGKNYFEAELYDEHYMAGGGQYEILCAFEGDNDLTAGVIALTQGELSREDTVTLCLLAVDPGFSGRGVAGLLLDHAINQAKTRGAAAMKARVVTRHDIVQGMVEKRGFIPTGLLYGIRDGKNAMPPDEGRLSLAAYAANISLGDTGCLYVHKDVLALVRRIYGGLGIGADFVPCGMSECPGEMAEQYNAHNHETFFQISVFGADSLAMIDGALRKRGGAGDVTATVFLNLSHPSAISGYESLRGAGYHFSGLDPLGRQPYALFYKGGGTLSEIKMTERLAQLRGEVESA